MAWADDIGGRGEALFIILMTKFHGRRRPFFRTHFVGEKFQTLDFLVELIGGPQRYFFFVQVKTTKAGDSTSPTGPRLKVRVSADDIRQMVSYPAPTYLVGIDEVQEIGYIRAIVAGMDRGLSGISTRFRLDAENLERLWHEVSAYWAARNMEMTSSQFLD